MSKKNSGGNILPTGKPTNIPSRVIQEGAKGQVPRMATPPPPPPPKNNK